MRMLIYLLALAALAPAQETRREIVNAAPTPALDAKANSGEVPDVYAFAASSGTCSTQTRGPQPSTPR